MFCCATYEAWFSIDKRKSELTGEVRRDGTPRKFHRVCSPLEKMRRGLNLGCGNAPLCKESLVRIDALKVGIELFQLGLLTREVFQAALDCVAFRSQFRKFAFQLSDFVP